MHAAVAARSVAILTVAYGPWLLLVSLAVILVAWSRVELGDHTAPQVTAGSVIGVLVGGLPYWLMTLGSW